MLHKAFNYRVIYLTSHDVHHLLADDADLGGLRVGGFLDLVLSLLGESDAEKSQFVAVGGGDVDVGFDFRLPLLDHGALLVASEFHAVEVGEARVALNLFAHQAKTSVNISHQN